MTVHQNDRHQNDDPQSRHETDTAREDTARDGPTVMPDGRPSGRSATESNGPLLPGSTIGVVGSGQLGRMLAIAAKPLGYRVHTFTGSARATLTPAGQVADREVSADFSDRSAIEDFVSQCDVVTFEFENVDATVGAVAAGLGVPVRPDAVILHTTQNRLREKRFLGEHRFPMARWAEISAESDIAAAVEQIPGPAILKTAAFGYDGKGQTRVTGADQIRHAWEHAGRTPCVLEEVIEFVMEASVVVARGVDGSTATHPPFENHHSDHILDVTVVPARLPQRALTELSRLAVGAADALGFVGVMCVEFFITSDGRMLVNEIAPRPHNSGHLSIEACATSQFEQQVRAICGLPLGSTELRAPAAMANLLGDLWSEGEPNWVRSLEHGESHLHLYGKVDPREGRKMGHLTVLGTTASDARERALAVRDALIHRTPSPEQR